MNKLVSAVLIITLTTISCEFQQKDSYQLPDGVYTGTFQRRQANGGGSIAQITITFLSNTWSGQGDIPKYPALCHGTYKIDNQKIIFTNDCVWTADFDGSLILSGEYNFHLSGNQLEINRSFLGPSTDTWNDIYSLTKQE